MPLHRGKIARTPTITSVRALTRDDLMLLKEERAQTPDRHGTSVVARLRDPHHRLARLIAAGLKLIDAAERAGFSYARACTLQKDPAFAELIATYRGKVDEAYIREVDQFHEQAMANMRKAEAQIAEKLEEAEETGERLPTRDLIAITSDRMDRFGYGKRQTNMNVNVDFAAMLEKARARSTRPTLIEAAPIAPDMPRSPSATESPASSPRAGGTNSPRAPAAANLRRI